jgi:hypothetical protein
MTQMMNNKCPICNTEYQGADFQFCPECGWELVSIPNNASDDLKHWFAKKQKEKEDELKKIVVDIGGSSARFGLFDGEKVVNIIRRKISSFDELVKAIKECANGKVIAIAVSIAGLVKTEDGVISRSSAAPYLEGNLGDRLKST